MKLRLLLLSLVLVAGYSCKTEPKSSLADYQGEENYSVIISETKVGYLKANTSGDTINIDYDYKTTVGVRP